VKTRKLLMSAAAAGATVIMAAGPAWAGENARARTTDANPGGEAYWFHDGDRFRVCDIQSDGWSVEGQARRSDGFFTPERDGGDPGCDTITIPRPEGSDMDIRVCLYKPSEGLRSCSGWLDAEA
jgi:hypothetical protein